MVVQATASFGRELRLLRLAAGLSQESLAARAGISADAVAALECGRRRRPRAHTIQALASALGLDEPAIARLRSAVGGAHPAIPAALATQLRPMIGRDDERRQLVDLLTGPARLVTLTGPAGVGKTRLALSAAQCLADGGEVTVHWVWLGPVSRPDVLATAVAAAVDARDTPDWQTDPDAVQPIVDRLAGAATVLVLDNCEHVIDAAARLADELVARTERMRVLATSREALGVSGELVRPVAPLSMPASQADLRPADLDRWPATRLFLDRARDVVPDFPVDSPTAGSIAQVCRCVDGLPLAIELAAARMNVLTAGQLAVDLSASLCAVGEGPRTAPRRHRTLDAAISWSYDLLDPLEQTLLARLSVAPGSWSLEAARHFAVGGPITADAVPELVPRLVRKSLLVLRTRDGLGRYAMLRVIRLYASERLAAAGEAPVVRERHARYYSALAERAAAGMRGPDQQPWLDRLDAETDNLRAALQYWRDAGAADDSLRTATALWRFAYLRGRYVEGRKILDTALTLADTSGPTDPLLQAGALVAAGTLAYLQCDYDLGGERLRAGLALYRTAGHTAGIAEALQRLGSIARERGCYADAVSWHEEALALRRADGDTVGIGDALNYLAFVAWLRGEPRTAEPLATQALDCFRHTAAGAGSVSALLNLGIAARYRGALTDADRLVRESLELAEQLGYAEGIAWCLDQLGALARARGELPLAWDLQQESLTRHAQLGDRWRAASVLEGLAVTAAAREQYRAAARLAGIAQSLRAAIGTPRPPCDDAEYDAAIATTAAALGPDEYANHTRITRPQQLLTRLAETTDLTDSGIAAFRAEVEELARRGRLDLPGQQVDLCDGAERLGLTRREGDVLALLAEGRTNRQIGRELFITEKTASIHVSRILMKLGVSNRGEAAAAAHRLGLTRPRVT